MTRIDFTSIFILLKEVLFSVTSGGLAAFERGCTELSDESKYSCQQVNQGKDQSRSKYNCQQVNKGGHQLHYCNCHGSRCNEDWITAGEVLDVPQTMKLDLGSYPLGSTWTFGFDQVLPVQLLGGRPV